MRTKGAMERTAWRFKQYVYVPKKHRRYLWDYSTKAPLELYLLRVLSYGTFEDIKHVCKKYPQQCRHIIKNYSLKRGVRYWVKRIVEETA